MPPRQLSAVFQTVRLQPPPPPSPVSLALDVDDMLMEILLRLPAKSLSRLKCVCKKWRTLISSDHLCHQHTLRRPKLQPYLILHTSYPHKFWYMNPSITINGEKKMILFSLSVPTPVVPYYEIVQACNGLMLLKLMHIYNPTKISYCIYNPATRQSREIMSFYDPAAIGLAFDPSKSPYYKIVCIRSIGESDVYTYQIEVYDSESHTWKLSLDSFIEEDSPFETFGTFWNNAIYWSFSFGTYYKCFDIDKNELKTLPFPQTPPDFDEWEHDSFNTYLQESDGHLYHFELFKVWLGNKGNYDKESVTVLVWELVGDEDSQWIFKYHNRITFTARWMPYIWRSRSMGGSGSGSGSDGDGTCSLLTYGGSGKMTAYSFLDKSYEDFVDLATQPGYQQDYYNRLSVKCFQFGEVLALV